MLPGVWMHTKAAWGNSGGDMSPALGDIGLRKILPTAVKTLGMDLTIPGKGWSATAHI